MSQPISSEMPTSPLSERITTNPRTDDAALRPPQDIPMETNETDRTNDLQQQIFQAVQKSDWQFVQQEIIKLGPEYLAGMTIITQTNPVVRMNWNPLCIIISAAKDNFTQRASILDTVKAIVDDFHSNNLKRLIILNRAHYNGKAPLHVATSLPGEDGFRTTLVEYLLSRGAIAAIPDNNGQTPLHLAAANLCEGSIRVLLKCLAGVTHRLYDVNFATPLNYALAACRNQTPETTKVVDATNPSNSVAEKHQNCINLLKDYQNRMKEAPEPENPGRIEKYDSSSVCMSSAYVLKSQPPITNLALRKVTTTLDWITIPRPVTDILEGPGSLLSELRCQNNDPSLMTSRPATAPLWLHLPAHNLEWVQKAAGIVFGSNENLLKSTLSFIEYLRKENKFSRPGFYHAWDNLGQPTQLPVQCSVLPVLDVNKRAPLHCRHSLKNGHNVQDRRRNCLKNQASGLNTTEQEFWTEMSRLWEAHGENVLSLEQTLDEYCYRSLSNNPAKLDQRDQDQVLSRYFNNKALESPSTKEERPAKAPLAALTPEGQPCAGPQKADEGPILVVSHLLVWKLDDLIITTYGDKLNPISPNVEYLRQRVWARCKTMQAYMQPPNLPGAMIFRCILEEAAKHEPIVPMYPNARVYARLLDGEGPFASEITVESHEVTASFRDYERTLELGQVDATFKKSVLKETQVLERLDDILNEIAMIRRVQEDARLVCLDSMFDDIPNYSLVESWVGRGRSKLELLENEALRVRKSLVTLLSLKQREVNAEGLINSELQSQILFVFTAATVVFTSLSWISSLMALNIEGFTPRDSKWSIHAAASSSSVTLAGFIILMALCLLVWRHKSVLEFANKMTKGIRNMFSPVQRLGLQISQHRMSSEGGTAGQKMGV